MENNATSNMEMLARSDIMSFAHCILELVANSLAAQATAIAIRIHAERREIRVIDNGVGMQKSILEDIAEYNAKIISNRRRMYGLIESSNCTLINIRRLSDTLTIASRYRYSTETFMKVFKLGCAPNLAQIEQRPSHGTTVSIYGFHEIPLRENWDVTTVCFFLVAIAVAKFQVSFSIRDDDRGEVVLKIAKPHSPMEALRILFGEELSSNRTWSIRCDSECNTNCHGYIGLCNGNAMQRVFLNHRPIRWSLVLKLIKIAFKDSFDFSLHREHNNVRIVQDKNIFVLFFLTFSQKEFAFVIENGKRYILFHDIQKILSSIKNCAFECLGEKTTVSTSPSYLREKHLLRRVNSTSKSSVSDDDISGHKEIVTPLTEKKKIVMIGVERKRIISSTVTKRFSKRLNKINNIEAVSCCTEKQVGRFNNIQRQKNIISAKPTKLCEDKPAKETYNDNVDETLTNYINRATINNRTDKIYDNKNSVNIISPLSEWSDWAYHTNDKERNAVRSIDNVKDNMCSQRLFRCTETFHFLPRKLSCLLLRRHVKLTNVKCFSYPDSVISLEGTGQRGQTEVHPCNLKQGFCEFRLSRASLESIKVINQVNNEFIAVWATHDGMKILLMMDQHAVHERIRYEDLLLRYKAQEGQLLSINLRDPLAVKFATKTSNLLLRNKELLKKYGVSLGSSRANRLLIRTIPQCLVTDNDRYSSEKLLPKIYSLLNDILEKHDAKNHTLPSTIRNAIASEACHGAIKFGDELTFEQCVCLTKLLKYTRSPNRCAHGRPTTVPVIELSELEKRSARLPEKKLNFACLKRDY